MSPEEVKWRYTRGEIDYLTLCEEMTAAVAEEAQQRRSSGIVAAQLFAVVGDGSPELALLPKGAKVFSPQPWANALASALSQRIILERQVVDGTADDQQG